MVASIGMFTMLSGRKPDCLAAKFIFVLAAGSAPVRAVASQELVTTISTDYIHIDRNVAMRLMMSALLISVATLVILVCSKLLGSQQPELTSTSDASTQTDQLSARECGATIHRGPDDIYVYPQ
eukprot:5154068-Amphidinium_carterae.1